MLSEDLNMAGSGNPTSYTKQTTNPTAYTKQTTTGTLWTIQDVNPSAGIILLESSYSILLESGDNLLLE